TGGRGLLNGVRIKPAKEGRPGDEVEVRVGQTTWTVRILAIADKRGSASVAAGLYQETPQAAPLREQSAQQPRLPPPPRPLPGPPGPARGAGRATRPPRRLDARGKSMRARRGGIQ